MQRRTRQREAIERQFSEAAPPRSPQEILERASGEVEGLSLSTVYRALRDLETRGRIIPVEIPGSPRRYERAGKDHHHHFHCRACGRVFEIQECPGSVEQAAPHGFEVDGHELTLFGRCDRCARLAATARR